MSNAGTQPTLISAREHLHQQGPGAQQGCEALLAAGVLAGVDEAGRGCLAGPVIAAAVILPVDSSPEALIGLNDSKALSEPGRRRLATAIQQTTACWAYGRAEPEEIDTLNILQASLLAMQRAVQALTCAPAHVLVDGNHAPRLPMPCTSVVRGDGRIREIAAASILAKVYRDAEMQKLDKAYPGYGFAHHKGYPVPAHRQALRSLGPAPIHRRSFRPVRDYLAGLAP